MLEIDPAIEEIRARMAASRAQIRLLLDPAPASPEEALAATAGGQFPRSKTMKMLLSGRGVGTVGAVVGGLVIARPALALRVLRVLPTGALARLLLAKGVAALRGRPRTLHSDPPSVGPI